MTKSTLRTKSVRRKHAAKSRALPRAARATKATRVPIRRTSALEKPAHPASREELDHLRDLADDARNHLANVLINLEEVERGIVPWLEELGAGKADKYSSMPFAFENNASFAADRFNEIYRHATRALAMVQHVAELQRGLWLRTTAPEATVTP